MPGQQRLQQVDELLAVDVLPGQPQVHVVVIVGAVRPQDVQPLAAVADADEEPLPDQQPAGIEQVQAPDRVAGVHEVAPGPRPRLAPLPPILPDERLLLVAVGLPEEAGDLVVAGADAAEQVLHAGGRVGDAEGLLDPGAHLVGVVEAPPGDLLLESLDLGGAEPTGIAPVVEGAECVQSLVAEDPQPLADLACRDARQFGDLFPGPSGIDPEDGRQPLVDATVLGSPSSFLDVVSLLISQADDLHRPPSLPPLRPRSSRR